MNTSRCLVLASLLGIWIVPACTAADGAADEGEYGANSSAQAVAQVLTCTKLQVNAGSIGSGQTAANLATKQLSGTQDVWKNYVEFSPGASVTCTFSLPAGTSAASIESLAVQVNYRGATKATQRWTFEAWDASSSTWVYVGDNAFAADWKWSSATLNLPTPSPRFFSSGSAQIRYKTTSKVDASDVDQLVLLYSTGSGTGGSGGAGGTSGSGGAGSTAGTSGSGGSGGSVWQPRPGTSWQWQISGTIDTSVNVAMYDVDLFDTPQSTIDALHAAGRKVICYFSAGTYEDWRSDATKFPSSSYGNAVDGWPGENWLDTRNTTVRSIMQSRMDLAVTKHCDGVEPDNVDGYTNGSGFPLTSATQLDYNKFLATSAHQRSLSVGLKNDVDQVSALVGYFDWALNEQCFKYNECDTLEPFITANKAVFSVEYGASSLASTVCPKANALNFDTLIKHLSLDAWRVSCR
jgi:hypothetical protein